MKKTRAKTKKASSDPGRITIGELRRSDPVKARRLLTDGFRKYCTRMELVRLMRGEENHFGESCEHLVKDRKLGILSDVTGDERSIWLWQAALKILDSGFEPSKHSVRIMVERDLPKLFPPGTSGKTWSIWWRKSQLQRMLDDARGSRDKPLSSP